MLRVLPHSSLTLYYFAYGLKPPWSRSYRVVVHKKLCLEVTFFLSKSCAWGYSGGLKSDKRTFLNFWFSISTLALPFWRHALSFFMKLIRKKFSKKRDTFQFILRYLIFWSVSHRLYTNLNISILYYYNISWRMMKYCRIIDHYLGYQYM